MTPWPRAWALESDRSVQILSKCVTPDTLVNCRAATTAPALQGSLQDDGNRTRNFCSTWKLASSSCSVLRGHPAAGTSLRPRSQVRPIHPPGLENPLSGAGTHRAFALPLPRLRARTRPAPAPRSALTSASANCPLLLGTPPLHFLHESYTDGRGLPSSSACLHGPLSWLKRMSLAETNQLVRKQQGPAFRKRWCRQGPRRGGQRSLPLDTPSLTGPPRRIIQPQRRKGTVTQAIPWVTLEDVMLSDKSPSQEDKHGTTPLI